MNRITKLFERKNAGILSIFYTAGFPTLEATTSIAKQLATSGVDMIEIGIPFSDPIADGPVIQESNKVALVNGMNVKLLLDQVKQIRRATDTPLLLMGYLNPVLQYGMEKFCNDAFDSGVDGLILPDMPMFEFTREHKPAFDRNKLSPVFLVSPTTSENRIREIDSMSNGFIYAVSSSSTTGIKDDFNAGQEEYVSRLRSMKLRNPFLVGFGISSRKTFEKVNKYAAGAIVGSAFIRMLQQSNDLESDIQKFVRNIKGNQE